MENEHIECILKALGAEIKIDKDENRVTMAVPFRRIKSLSRGRLIWRDISTNTIYIVKVKDKEDINGLNCKIEYTNGYWEKSIADKIWESCPKCGDTGNFKKITSFGEIGDGVSLICENCGYEEDITNYDLW